MAQTKITENETNISYSTSEKLAGKTWIDGKPIYRKTINFGALPNATTKNVAHGITSLGLVIDYSGWATNGTNFVDLPHAAPTATNCIETYITPTNVSCVATGNWSPYSVSYITIEYTKT